MAYNDCMGLLFNNVCRCSSASRVFVSVEVPSVKTLLQYLKLKCFKGFENYKVTKRVMGSGQIIFDLNLSVFVIYFIVALVVYLKQIK